MPVPLYVHSDLSRYLAAFPHLAAGAKSAEEMSERVFSGMLHDLEDLSDGQLIVPSYNYSFTKTGLYDMRADISDVGRFSELFRQTFLPTRSSTPVFSNCSTQPDLLPQTHNSAIDPFDDDADFGVLVKLRGRITNFGSSFGPTFIMYIERHIEGGPLYRYDKVFTGHVVDPIGVRHAVSMLYHVRPLQVNLTYDLNKIESELESQGILEHCNLRNVFRYTVYDARGFLDYSLDQIAKDPFYFLTRECRSRLIDAGLFKNGRVRQSDFEG